MSFFTFVVDIHTDNDDKEVERYMYASVLYFRGSYDRYGYEYWENQIILSNN